MDDRKSLFEIVIPIDKVHVQPVLSILLATFAGLGVVMSGSSIIVEFLRWKRRRNASADLYNNLQNTDQRTQTGTLSHVAPPDNHTETGN